MPDPNKEKIFDSIFVKDLKVDVYNFITEVLINNYLEFARIQKPRCAFWQKEYQSNDLLKFLGKKYQIELIHIKRLTKKYTPKVIMTCFKQNKIGSYGFLKQEKRVLIDKRLEETEREINKPIAKAPELSSVETSIETSVQNINDFSNKKSIDL